MRSQTTIGFLMGTLSIATNVGAQINPGILAEPWRDGPHRAETIDEVLVFERAQANETNLVTGTFYWDSYGRIKLDKQADDPDFVIGYKALAVGFDANSPIKDGDFWDVAVVAAGRVGELGDGWQLELLGGIGSANDGHWWNTDALYGVGSIGATRKLDTTDSIHAGVYYDGNRDLIPAVPLPYVAYRREFNRQLAATLGLPSTTVSYQPSTPVQFEIDYTFPDEFTARGAYKLTRNVIVFVQYARSTDAFHIDGRGSERLFYELERVNGGLRWITKLFDASLGVGYAFDQRFSHGYDIRDLSRISRLEDAPFLALKLQGTF